MFMNFNLPKKIGTIHEITRDNRKVEFEWRIPKIFSMRNVSDDIGLPHTSPSINFLGLPCSLIISLSGCKDRYWVEMKIRRDIVQSDSATSMHYSVGTNKVHDCERIISGIIPGMERSSGDIEFLSSSDIVKIKSQLITEDTFTIICRLWDPETSLVKGKILVSRKTQTEDVKVTSVEEEDLDSRAVIALRKDLKDALVSRDNQDVVFKVQDREFRAHKLVLCARSPVFAAMFRNKMKESISDCVEIDDCNPETFGDFLHYVYTGEVQNLSSTNALSLYYVGDKYDLSLLKESCVKFLMTSLSPAVISDVITLATRHNEDVLLKRATSFFSQNLEEIIITAEWQRFLTRNPIQGNELFLKSVQNLKEVFKKPE